MNTAPLFFISHGAPTFALEPGELGPQLAALGRQIADVNAVLVISPHWQTSGLRVSATEVPETIHDFGGFPQALYQLQYPVAGAPQQAEDTARLLASEGFPVKLDRRRGLDHGAWVPLLHLLPEGDIPCYQLSMPFDLDPMGSVQLGRALAPLRERGVMIVCSGSMTHNLYEFRQWGTDEADYVRQFSSWIHDAVMADELEKLVGYRTLAPDAKRAHPTDEHFLPLLVALGARNTGETSRFLEGGITYGVLSMDSYAWGLAA